MIRYESTRRAIWSYLSSRRVGARVVPDFGQPYMMVHHQRGDRLELLVSDSVGEYPMPEQNSCFAIEVARAMLGHIGYVADSEQARHEELERKRHAGRLLIPDDVIKDAIANGWSVEELAHDACVTDELAELRMADYKVVLFVIQVKHEKVPCYDSELKQLFEYDCLQVQKSYRSLDVATKAWCKHSPRSAKEDYWKTLQLYGKKMVQQSMDAGLYDRFRRVDHWIMTVVAVG